MANMILTAVGIYHLGDHYYLVICRPDDKVPQLERLSWACERPERNWHIYTWILDSVLLITSVKNAWTNCPWARGQFVQADLDRKYEQKSNQELSKKPELLVKKIEEMRMQLAAKEDSDEENTEEKWGDMVETNKKDLAAR